MYTELKSRIILLATLSQDAVPRDTVKEHDGEQRTPQMTGIERDTS